LVLAAAVWHMWKERNRRIFNKMRCFQCIFNNEELPMVQRFFQLRDDIKILMQGCNWMSDSDANHEVLQNWGIEHQ